MYDPTDIGPAPEAYIAGDKCPECGEDLQFGEGDQGSYDTPQVDATIWCECGATYEVDWKRHNCEVSGGEAVRLDREVIPQDK